MRPRVSARVRVRRERKLKQRRSQKKLTKVKFLLQPLPVKSVKTDNVYYIIT